MRLRNLLLIIILLLNSCSLFKSSEELLLSKSWALYSDHLINFMDGDKSIAKFYEKDEVVLDLEFTEYGLLIISNPMDEDESETCRWEYNPEEESIIIKDGGLRGGYSINDIDDNELVLFYDDDIMTPTGRLMYFKPHNDPEWPNPGLIKSMNNHYSRKK